MNSKWATDDEIRSAWAILKETGACREGHFLYRETGYHYDRFFQLPLAYQYSRNARILAVTLARMMRRSGLISGLDPERIFTLVAPSDVAIPIVFWAGDVLEAHRVLWMPKLEAERSFYQFVELGRRDQVIILTDIMFSGNQVSHAVKQIQERSAEIHGIVAVVDRREERVDVGGVEVVSLLQSESTRYTPESCPHCKQGVELTEIRHS